MIEYIEKDLFKIKRVVHALVAVVCCERMIVVALSSYESRVQLLFGMITLTIKRGWMSLSSDVLYSQDSFSSSHYH